MTMPPESGYFQPHMPPADVLAALGEISIRHGYLDLVLRRTIKTLARITIEESDKAFSRTSAGELRDLIERHARERLGRSHPALHRLQALLYDCEEVTRQRNRHTHDPWAKFLDNDSVAVYRVTGEDLTLPSASELQALAQRIHVVAGKLNNARTQGFLGIALQDLDEAAMMKKQP